MLHELRPTWILAAVIASFMSITPQSCAAQENGQLEKDLTQIAQTFRIRAYNRFRTDRTRYDLWMSSASQVDETTDPTSQKIAWFRIALSQMEAGEAHPPSVRAQEAVHPQPLTIRQPAKTPQPRTVSPRIVVAPPERTEPIRSTVHSQTTPSVVVHTQPPKQSPPDAGLGILDQPAQTTTPDQMVDVSVLSARIRSINLSLGRIEDALVETRLITIDELRLLTTQFDDYLSQLKLTTIYVSILSEQQVRRVAEIRSPDFVLKQMERAIRNRQTRLETFVAVEPAKQADIDELDSLLRRVQSWQQMNAIAN
jgi:hypothetical protein